jgi:nucleoside 2-deoxyribosyltransferase
LSIDYREVQKDLIAATHKRFYIASSLSNAEAVKALRNDLVDAGYRSAYDWTVHGSVQHMPHKWTEIAEAEIEGVFDADFVVVLLPGGRGTHVELGIALARSVPIILVGSAAQLITDGRVCVFYFDSEIHRVNAAEDVLAKVAELEEKGVIK